jgi:hypothetical protein
LRQLERQGFLADAADGMIQDGSFLLFEGDLQIVDPAMVSRYLGSSQDLKAAETAFSKDTEKPESTKAKRRAAHRSHAKPTVDKWPSRSQTDSLNKVLELFAGGSARVRVIRDGTTVAVGVVEREKFVEDLERIIGRHGQLFGGQWSVLAQANSKAEREPYGPDEGNVFDLIEGGGAKLLEAVGEIGGPGSVGLAITPLAIYRTISPHR